jgi:hypothetical protein
MSNEKIIVWDPSGEYWQGGIVDVESAMALEARGVAMLPVQRDLLQGGALSGFYFRAWGAGWPLAGSTPRMCCPMALRASPFDSAKPDAPAVIYWMARLVPDGVQDADWRPLGTVRLASDSGQLGAFGVGLAVTPRTAFDLSGLGKPDREGGWTISGDARFGVQTDMTLGLGLYCSGPGLRVAWAAVSQSD